MQNLILNRYRPLEEAGAGGFATVLAAWDTRIQRRVAIKCLRLDGYASPADARSPREIPGLDEARTAAMLSDSHIVGVYDFDASGAQAYLIMEYMDGITLTELMREEGALSLVVASCVFEAVAGALETAHENQVLHLDIKPDNVLINRQGQVKVADFGLSQLSHAAGYGRAAGGTIGYMPLEQMRLEACDARTDEWALAALTYEMLVGENPFRAPGLDAAERAIEQAEVFVPSMVRGDLNEEVDEALFGALAIDRDDRFDSVELFADAMLPHMGDARRGARELAVLVGEACDDGAVFDEGCGAASAFLPGRGGSYAGLSVIDRIAPRTKSLVARLWAAVVCGFAAFEAAANIPACMTIAGRMEPAFWGVVGVAVAAALAWPGAGAAFAVGALVVALALSGSPFLALALALAGVSVACSRWRATSCVRECGHNGCSGGRVRLRAGGAVARGVFSEREACYCGYSVCRGFGVLPGMRGLARFDGLECFRVRGHAGRERYGGCGVVARRKPERVGHGGVVAGWRRGGLASVRPW